MSCAVCCGKENSFHTQHNYLVPQVEGELARVLASAVRARPGTIYFLSGDKQFHSFCFYGRPSFEQYLSPHWSVLQLLRRTLSKKCGWLIHVLLKANILNAEVTMELEDGVGWTGIWKWPWPGAYPGFVGPEAYTIFGALFKKKNTKLGTKVNICLEWENKLQQYIYIPTTYTM